MPTASAAPPTAGSMQLSPSREMTGPSGSVIEYPINSSYLTHTAPSRQPGRPAGYLRHVLLEHPSHSTLLQGPLAACPPPLMHHQGGLFDTATPTSPRSSMGVLSDAPAALDGFTPDPAGGAALPPSTALASIPAHQPSKVPSTRFPAHGPLPFTSFPPYGYGMPFPPIPSGVPGTPMTNSYPGGPSQMPVLFPPMMNYYYPPAYGQQPPHPLP